MEQHNALCLLELIERPAFAVRDGIVVQANRAAMQLLVIPKMSIADILGESAEQYAAFSGGTLLLRIGIGLQQYSATVSRMDGFDLFLLENSDAVLQVLELAAQQLRRPLNDVLVASDRICSKSPALRKEFGALNKGLNQLHRTLGNMADLRWYLTNDDVSMEETNLTSFFQELMEKLQALTSSAGYTLYYTGPMQLAIGPANRMMLERAVSNLVSNAIKFSPSGTAIDASLTLNGDILQFSLINEGQKPEYLGAAELFDRYLRVPGIEEGRHGLGLGLPLVCAVASAHGGTVLIDEPTASTTRVTMTMLLSTPEGTDVNSPVMLPVSDYAGGRDRGLLELSEVLPCDAYSAKY